MYIFVLFQYNVNFEVFVLIPFFFSFYEMAGIDKDIEGERSTTSKQH